MGAIDEIEAWLKSARKDYANGLLLLESYSNKPAMVEQLRKYKDVAMLTRMLNSLADRKLPLRKKAPKVSSSSSSHPSSTDIKEDLNRERISIAKEIDHLKNRLYYIGRNTISEQPYELSQAKIKERYEIARQLIGNGGLHERFHLNLKAYRTYEATGKLPEPEPVEEPLQVSGDVYLLKENCRKQVARLKNKINKAREDAHLLRGNARKQLKLKAEVWEGQLAKEQKRLKQLEKLLRNEKRKSKQVP